METKRITVSRHVNFNEEATKVEKPKRNWPVIDMSTMKDNDEKEIKSINEEDTINDEDMIDKKIKKPEEPQSTGPKLRDRSKIQIPQYYEANCIDLKKPEY